MSLAEEMRNHNKYKQMFNFGRYMPGECFPEVDIRYAEFIDWLNEQDQSYQDVVTIAMHLSTAFNALYSPLEHPPIDDENLERVQKAQERLGINFLYKLNKEVNDK